MQLHFDSLALGNVSGGGEHALKFTVPVVEGRGVVGDHRLLTVAGTGGQLIVGDRLLAQHSLDAGLGAGRVGEAVLERGADEFVPGAAGERFHLLVDVGNDARRIGGHQGVDVRLDQGAGVELLVAQPLVGLLLLLLHLLARRVVGADQQIADDRVLGVA